jgi:adenylate cyclase
VHVIDLQEICFYMELEIEKKFLIDKGKWEMVPKPEATFYIQGYLHTDADLTVRVRFSDNKGFLTIKGKSKGITRPEYEFEIDRDKAIEMIEVLSKARVEKKRYEIVYKGKTWEVDEFLGKNEGLIMAEIELESEDESFEKPDWIGLEVTEDERYYNAYLAINSFSQW